MKNRNTIFTTVVIACVGLFPTAEAVVPAPDGGYPGQNTAEGQDALFSLTTGTNNTAVGFFSLYSDTQGRDNTAIGAGALFANTGNDNTAVGWAALLFNNIGFDNTAVGGAALFRNTEGSANTAVGRGALQSNTTGGNNVAVGRRALIENTGGGANTAVGDRALENNSTGSYNTAIGFAALANSTTGQHNKALGVDAGANVTTASGVICIGAHGANVSNSCFIGNIFGKTSASGVPVLINSQNKLGTVLSSRRFKKEIKPMDRTSEAVLALKPVTFQYKNDEESMPQFGLIAEEVFQVNPDLVVRDNNGELSTVRYEAVNAMLLNEFLKEHRKVENLEGTVRSLQKEIETLAASLKTVSDKSKMSKFSANVACNDQ